MMNVTGVEQFRDAVCDMLGQNVLAAMETRAGRDALIRAARASGGTPSTLTLPAVLARIINAREDGTLPI